MKNTVVFLSMSLLTGTIVAPAAASVMPDYAIRESTPSLSCIYALNRVKRAYDKLRSEVDANLQSIVVVDVKLKQYISLQAPYTVPVTQLATLLENAGLSGKARWVEDEMASIESYRRTYCSSD